MKQRNYLEMVYSRLKNRLDSLTKITREDFTFICFLGDVTGLADFNYASKEDLKIEIDNFEYIVDFLEKVEVEDSMKDCVDYYIHSFKSSIIMYKECYEMDDATREEKRKALAKKIPSNDNALKGFGETH